MTRCGKAPGAHSSCPPPCSRAFPAYDPLASTQKAGRREEPCIKGASGHSCSSTGGSAKQIGLEGEAFVTGQLAQCRPQQWCPLPQTKLLQGWSPHRRWTEAKPPPAGCGRQKDAAAQLSWQRGRLLVPLPVTTNGVAEAPSIHGPAPHRLPASPYGFQRTF